MQKTKHSSPSLSFSFSGLGWVFKTSPKNKTQKENFETGFVETSLRDPENEITYWRRGSNITKEVEITARKVNYQLPV